MMHLYRYGVRLLRRPTAPEPVQRRGVMTESAAERPSTASHTPPVVREMKHILLCSSAPMFSSLLRAVLCRLGYSVSTESGGQETPPSPAPDLIVMDLPQEKAEAGALVARVRRVHAEAPAIGLVDEATLADADTASRLRAAARLVAKPFKTERLLAAIELEIGVRPAA